MEMFCIRSRYFAFELCQFIIYPPSLEEGGAEGNPGAGLHSAPFQHPYTRKSTTTPSGVHSMFAGLPIVKTFHLPHNPSHISIRHICHELSTHRHSLPSDVDFTGCILTLPTRFWTVPVRAVATLLCDFRSRPSGTTPPLGALIATLLFDFRARPPGTTRPLDALLIIASCIDPFDPPCDIMHGSTYSSRTVRACASPKLSG